MAAREPGSQCTCRHDNSALVGGHVGGRRAVLLIHVAVVVHGVGLACAHELAAFAHAAVHWRLPGMREDKAQRVSTVAASLRQAGQGATAPPGAMMRMAMRTKLCCYLPCCQQRFLQIPTRSCNCGTETVWQLFRKFLWMYGSATHPTYPRDCQMTVPICLSLPLDHLLYSSTALGVSLGYRAIALCDG